MGNESTMKVSNDLKPAGTTDPLHLQVHLRKIPLLAELTPEQLAQVAAEIRIRQYSKREIVLHKGGSGDGLLFLLAGQLQVMDITEEGRAVGLRLLAQVFTIVWLVGCAGWAIQVLWRV